MIKELKQYDSSTTSILYLALTSLIANNKNTMLLPDLLYAFDIDDIFRFIQMYGGQQVRVPKMKIIKEQIMVIVYFYCNKALRMSDEEFRERFDVPRFEWNRLNKSLKKWQKYLKSEKIVIPKYVIKSNSALLKTLDILLRGENETNKKHKVIGKKRKDKKEKNK